MLKGIHDKQKHWKFGIQR